MWWTDSWARLAVPGEQHHPSAVPPADVGALRRAAVERRLADPRHYRVVHLTKRLPPLPQRGPRLVREHLDRVLPKYEIGRVMERQGELRGVAGRKRSAGWSPCIPCHPSCQPPPTTPAARLGIYASGTCRGRFRTDSGQISRTTAGGVRGQRLSPNGRRDHGPHRSDSLHGLLDVHRRAVHGTSPSHPASLRSGRQQRNREDHLATDMSRRRLLALGAGALGAAAAGSLLPPSLQAALAAEPAVGRAACGQARGDPHAGEPVLRPLLRNAARRTRLR